MEKQDRTSAVKKGCIKAPDVSQVKFDEKGLVVAIVQDADTRMVLMQAYMNAESYAATLKTGRACFFSRSRTRLWTKGEESGNFMYVSEILADCDSDSLLVKVLPAGPACHTGSDTCWGEKNSTADFLFYLQDYLEERKNDSPEESYTARLISRGINKVAQKVGEEAVEVVEEEKEKEVKILVKDPDVELDIAEDEEIAMTEADDDVVTIEE